MTEIEEQEAPPVTGSVPLCRDHDEDCDGVNDKLACWLYDPARGFCPYLRTP